MGKAKKTGKTRNRTPGAAPPPEDAIEPQPWQVGESLAEFRLRVRDMFTEDEYADINNVEDEEKRSCFHLDSADTFLNVRLLIRAVLNGYYDEGCRIFRLICADGSKPSIVLDCTRNTGEGLHKCSYQGRTVPMLKCSFRRHEGTDSEEGQPARPRGGVVLTVATAPEALRQFAVHVTGATANQEDESAIWSPLTLLPAYPACGPTQPDSGSSDIQHITAVKTHHYFVKTTEDDLMCDADDRIYFFLSREDANAWAEILGFPTRFIVGVGDEKWEQYRETAKITLVKDPRVVINANLHGGSKAARLHPLVMDEKLDGKSGVQPTTKSAQECAQSKRPSKPTSKLDVAESAKLKGNEQFCAKDYAKAIKLYENGIAVLRKMTVEDEGAHGDRWRQLFVDISSNAAQCHILLGDGSAAHRACTEALRHNPGHEKSRLRLKKALEMLKLRCEEGAPADAGRMFTEAEYYSAGDFELGICAGLAVDVSLLTKPGRLHPLIAEVVLGSADEKKLQHGFLVVARRLHALAHGASQNDSRQAVLLKLEWYIQQYRSELEKQLEGYSRYTFERLLFASLVFHGALQAYVFSNPKAAVLSIKEAWEMRHFGTQHPWVEFLLARAYGGLTTDKASVEAGLHHFKSMLKKFEQHLQTRPTHFFSNLRMDSDVLALGAHIHYEAAMQHAMKFFHIEQCKTPAKVKQLCATLIELKDAGDALEHQFSRESPDHVGIVHLPARDELTKILQQISQAPSKKAEQSRRDAARRKLQAMLPYLRDGVLDDGADDDAQSRRETFSSMDDILELATPDAQQKSIDLARKRRAESRQRALSACEQGEGDAFDGEHQRLFRDALKSLHEHSFESEKLLKAREQHAREAEQQLGNFIDRAQKTAQQLHRGVVEAAKQAEAELASREQDLREQHRQDLRDMTARLERQAQEEKETREKAFREQMSALQQQRAATYKMLDDELETQKRGESERQQLRELQTEQELEALREEMRSKDDIIEEQQRKAHEQQSAHEQVQREKRELERKYAEIWSHTKMPSTWSSNLSDKVGFLPAQIREPAVLAALQKCLTLSRPGDLGYGRDYLYRPHWPPHTKLHLAAAWRVENPMLMERYLTEKKKMRADLEVDNLQAEVPEVSRQVWTHLNGGVAALPEADELERDLNETFLFHGTRPITIPKIMHSGLNERVNQRGYFGPGTYLAECAGKADQYADLDKKMHATGGELHDLHELLYARGGSKQAIGSSNETAHPGNVFYILLCRAAIGYPVCSYDGQQPLQTVADASASGASSVRVLDKRGRATGELAVISRAMPGKPRHTHYHSLIIEKTEGEEWRNLQKCVWRYREFIFTHSERIYPQYLLAVQRRQ